MAANLEVLNTIVKRLETLEEEKTRITEDIREVYNEAKNEGLDRAILREVLKIRKMKPQEFSEKSELVQIYLDAIHV